MFDVFYLSCRMMRLLTMDHAPTGGSDRQILRVCGGGRSRESKTVVDNSPRTSYPFLGGVPGPPFLLRIELRNNVSRLFYCTNHRCVVDISYTCESGKYRQHLVTLPPGGCTRVSLSFPFFVHHVYPTPLNARHFAGDHDYVYE